MASEAARQRAAEGRLLLVVGLVLLGLLLPAAARADVLAFEITRAESAAGRLRVLGQRVSKQNLLYQLNLGDVRKSQLLKTAADVDRILESLERGSPSDSIPAPWTAALRERVEAVDAAWGPLRAMAIASQPDYIRLSAEAIKTGRLSGDSLAVRYVDDLAGAMHEAVEQLLDAYEAECRRTGDPICEIGGRGATQAMLIEKATKEAVFVFAGIDAAENRKRLKATEAEYQKGRKQNDVNPIVLAATAPDRGQSGKLAGEMLTAIRRDWDALRGDFARIRDGDTATLDMRKMLRTERELVARVERLTLALSRFATAQLASGS